VIFIVLLLRERDPGVLISHPHVERGAIGTDRKRSIAELAGKIEGFSQRLCLCQAQRVLSDL
jgi:hypothetical protein